MLLLPKDSYLVKESSDLGKGLFASIELPAGKVIADYIGKIILTSEIDYLPSIYAFERTEEHAVYPEDINAPGAHTVNHNCTANSTYYPFKDRTLIITKRRIFPGEEITAEYFVQAGTLTEPGDPHSCKCGSSLCRGTLVSPDSYSKIFDDIFESQVDFIDVIKLNTGDILKPLDSYPDIIDDLLPLSVFGSESEKPLNVKKKDAASIPQIRKLIRESGRILFLQEQGLYLSGVLYNDVLITKLI